MNEIVLHRISIKAFLKALNPVEPRKHGRPPSVRRRIVGTLALAHGDLVTRKELIEAVYGDKEDGGPLDAEPSIKVIIHHLRREGWPIRSHWGRGYSLRDVHKR